MITLSSLVICYCVSQISSSFFSGATQSIDDEYKWAGVEDPKIVVTTARDPSSKLKQFVKVTNLLLYS